MANHERGWNFTCQHGPNECRGNLYQACFLKLHEKEDLDEKVKVINCIMSNQSPDTATLNVCNLSIICILDEYIIFENVLSMIRLKYYSFVIVVHGSNKSSNTNKGSSR